MAIYSVTMVLWKETAFPVCRAMERLRLLLLLLLFRNCWPICRGYDPLAEDFCMHIPLSYIFYGVSLAGYFNPDAIRLLAQCELSGYVKLG